MATRFLLSSAALAGTLLLISPASAQDAGSAGLAGGVGAVGTGSNAAPRVVGPQGSTGAAGGVNGTSGTGIGGSPAAGGVGATPDLTGGAGSVGTSTPTSEERASEGSTDINQLNVDSIARGGGAGAASGTPSTVGAATSEGAAAAEGSSAPPSIAGAGPEELYDIPRATIAVDLQSIRNALAAEPSATPKPDGR